MPGISDEASSVQHPIIQYAQAAGWEYIDRKEASRLKGGNTGIFFNDIFYRQVQHLNAEFMTPPLAEALLNTLSRVRPSIEGNGEAWKYLAGKGSIYVPQEKRERNLTLIDGENIEHNRFQVTDEFTFSNGSHTIRQDITFLINGIPVLFFETKSARLRDGINQALDQVGTYHRRCPELLAVIQVYAVTQVFEFFYSATWNDTPKSLFNWKAESAGEDFEALVKSFLDRRRLVRLIQESILFVHEDDELSKVVLRPHQIRAVEQVEARCQDSQKMRGLVWHTQGSGKTYTMIVAAKKILENPLFQNPTVLMLVDRNELQTQLFGNLAAVGIEEVETVGSKWELKKILRQDRRGLIVSMIHKFDEIPADINTRQNFFVLVDEAHRTTTGNLGNYLMAALPNATYIGFTGTPIGKTAYGSGTFIVFGRDDPPNGYLDKYNIAESIADHTTVPLHYAMAPNTLLVDREVLDREFLDLAESEGVSDIEELNRILERAVRLRNMLKNRDRIRKVSQYVWDHYREYVEPLGFKAFLVAVDREACALYKQELDKICNPIHSEVVYSAGPRDSQLLAKFHLSEKEETRIRKDFRDPEKMPKILIVTEKLLTGYNAPILYCMYLDKPMRDHALLQTIARVNRPYEDGQGTVKPGGFILDFVGIFDHLEKALKFDSRDIEGVVGDIQALKERFRALIREAREKYIPIITGKSRDKAIEAIYSHFTDEENRQDFYRFFKELSTIFDIISPDSFLRPYLDDTKHLADMYQILRVNIDLQDTVHLRDFSQKTARLVQKHTHTGEIRPVFEVYEIDDQLIKRIEAEGGADPEKVFNLIRSIKTHIREKQPFLIPIAEKAERLAQQFREGQEETRKVLDKIKELVEEILDAKKEKEEKKIPDDILSIYWSFKSEGIENAEGLARRMVEVVKTHCHYKTSEAHERAVRRALHSVLFHSETLKGNLTRVKEVVDKAMRNLKNV